MVLAGWRGKSGLCEYISLPVFASIMMALRAESFLRNDLSVTLKARTGFLLILADLFKNTGELGAAAGL
jgi:hypothetical protein